MPDFEHLFRSLELFTATSDDDRMNLQKKFAEQDRYRWMLAVSLLVAVSGGVLVRIALEALM